MLEYAELVIRAVHGEQGLSRKQVLHTFKYRSPPAYGNFHLSDAAISGRAVIHLVQRHTRPRPAVVPEVSVVFHIGVSNSLAMHSLLETLAVVGLAIDVKALCGRGTENDTAYERHHRDFASHHRLASL